MDIYIYLIILLSALVFSLLTFRKPFLLSSSRVESKQPAHKRRFLMLLIGWVSLFSWASLYLNSLNNIKINVTSLLLVSFLSFLAFFLLFINLKGKEQEAVRYESKEYRYSKKPKIRQLIYKAIYIIFYLSIVLFLEYYPTVTKLYCIFILPFKILIICLFSYLDMCHPYYLFDFSTKRSQQVSRIFVILYPIFFSIIFIKFFNDKSQILNNQNGISVIYSIVKTLSFRDFLVGFFSLATLTMPLLKKLFSKNKSCKRSIISFPIAIQSKDSNPINRRELYHYIRDALKSFHNNQNFVDEPKTMVFFEKISWGWKETSAELIVVAWEQYQKSELCKKKESLNSALIDSLQKNGMHILNKAKIESVKIKGLFLKFRFFLAHQYLFKHSLAAIRKQPRSTFARWDIDGPRQTIFSRCVR